MTALHPEAIQGRRSGFSSAVAPKETLPARTGNGQIADIGGLNIFDRFS